MKHTKCMYIVHVELFSINFALIESCIKKPVYLLYIFP